MGKWFYFALIMIDIKKPYNSKILSFTISIIFLCSAMAYSRPVFKNSLRVPVGEIKSERSTLVLKEYYDGKAEDYDYNTDQKKVDAAASIFGQVVPLSFVRGSRLLDLATGTGLVAELAAQKGVKEIVGVDISEKMLDVARKKLEKFDNVDTRFVEGDLFNLVGLLGDKEKFDIVTIGNVLTHYSHEDRNRILLQAFRLLEPGGYLVIRDYRLFEGYIPSGMYHQISPEGCIELLEDLDTIEVNSCIVNEEKDTDFNIEISDLERVLKQNFVVWARKKPIEMHLPVGRDIRQRL